MERHLDRGWGHNKVVGDKNNGTYGFSEVLKSRRELTEGIFLGRPPSPSPLLASFDFL